MEPVGLAIGAIPLVLTIVNTSSRIRKTVATYKAASIEIERLAERLELVESQCNAVRQALLRLPSRRDNTSPPNDGLDSSYIARALHRAASRMDSIENVIATLMPCKGESTSRGLVRKMSLQYLSKKERIEELLRHLKEDMTDLNGMILIQVWSSSIARQASPQASAREDGRGVQHEPELEHSAIESSSDEEEIRLSAGTQSRSQPHSIPVSHRVRREFRNIGWITAEQVSKISGQNNGQDAILSTKTRYLIQLARFLPMVELSYQSSFRCWNAVSIRTFHTISFLHDTSRQIWRILGDSDDVESIHRLLHEGKISTSTRLQDWSIFAVALTHQRIGVCRYLAFLDSKILDTPTSSMTSVHPTRPPSVANVSKLIDLYLNLKQHEPDVSDFSFLLDKWWHPACFAICYQKFRPFFIGDVELPSFALFTFWKVFLHYRDSCFESGDFLYNLSDWQKLFQLLVKDMENVALSISKNLTDSCSLGHLNYDTHGGRLQYTAFYGISTHSPSFTASISSVRRWLRILGNCGVDVVKYLDMETNMLAKVLPEGAGVWRLDTPNCRQYRLQEMDGYIVPVWEPYVDPNGPASGVLAEFRLWDCSSLDAMRRDRYDPRGPGERVKRGKRFEKRMEKKMRKKGCPRPSLPGSPIPGSWVE